MSCLVSFGHLVSVSSYRKSVLIPAKGSDNSCVRAREGVGSAPGRPASPRRPGEGPRPLAARRLPAARRGTQGERTLFGAPEELSRGRLRFPRARREKGCERGRRSLPGSSQTFCPAATAASPLKAQRSRPRPGRGAATCPLSLRGRRSHS